MKKIYLFCFIAVSVFVCLVVSPVKALNVTIIDSRTYNAGQTMDLRWQTICQTMGHTATIYPKTELDLLSNLSTTDILIIPSAVDTVLTPARIQVIEQYLQGGGKVYLQSEYLSTFDGDVAYKTIVNHFGGTFNWTGVTAGTLLPNILGSIATDYTTTGALQNFWYGQSIDSCSDVEMFLQYQGQYFGCIYCVPGTGGRIITDSDQDWTFISNGWQTDSLMMNIISNLSKTSYQCVPQGVPSINLGADTTLCLGTSMILNAGAGFRSYLWQNGQTTSSISVSSAGTYSVQVSTACSSASDTVVVNFSVCGTPPVAVMTSSDTAFCSEPGECLDFFDHSTGNPTSWQWFFAGANPDTSTLQNPTSICYTTAGTFPVSLIVGNGFGSDTLIVSPLIIVGGTPPLPTIIVTGDTLTSSHAAAYQWFFNGNALSGATDSFYVEHQDGTYAVMITDALGCTRISSGVLITSIGNEARSQADLQIYPNPAVDWIEVRGEKFSDEAVIEIFNVIGETVLRSRLAAINISSFSKGVYWIQITNSEKIYRAKLIKE